MSQRVLHIFFQVLSQHFFVHGGSVIENALGRSLAIIDVMEDDAGEHFDNLDQLILAHPALLDHHPA